MLTTQDKSGATTQWEKLLVDKLNNMITFLHKESMNEDVDLKIREIISFAMLPWVQLQTKQNWIVMFKTFLKEDMLKFYESKDIYDEKTFKHETLKEFKYDKYVKHMEKQKMKRLNQAIAAGLIPKEEIDKVVDLVGKSGETKPPPHIQDRLKRYFELFCDIYTEANSN